MRVACTGWVAVALTIAAAHGAEFGGFAPHLDYGVGDGPYEVVVADFDDDSVLDLAMSNANQSATGSSVSILLGNGDGTFGAAVSYPVGWAPYSIEGADLAGRVVRDAERHATVHRNRVQVQVSAVVAHEGDGLTIRTEAWVELLARGAGQRDRGPPFSRREP
jgi:hypothetical protein